MIESVYSSETHGGTASSLMKIPKNVRQIGQANDIKKIYVEDYVMSYIKQLGIRRETTSDMVVLLGQFVKTDDCQCIFISGAVEAEDVLIEENLILTNETWTGIYENIKKFFTDVEIVGWCLIKAGLPLTINDKIQKMHVDNFAGQDKTLLMYDSLEREEAFYIYEDNKLKRQNGYYIYYDKNAEMQSYMISKKKGKGIETGIVNPKYMNVRRNIVPIDSHKKKMPSGLLYGTGIVASVVVLVCCIAAMNGGDGNGSVETRSVMSNNIATESVEILTSTLPVETAEGSLSTIIDDKEVSETPVASKQPTDSQKIEEASTKPSVYASSSAPATSKQSAAASTEPSASKKAAQSPSPSPSETTKKTETKESSSKAATTYEYYVVKKGDTLVSICKKLNKTTSYIKKIKALNDIDDTDKIKVGQKILLP